MTLRVVTTLPARLRDPGRSLICSDAGSLPDQRPLADFLIAGLDSIDPAACTAAGVPVTKMPVTKTPVTKTPGANAVVAAAHLSVSSGQWDRRIGAHGQRLAAKATALGMRRLARDPFANQSASDALGVTLLPLADLLAQCDHVSLQVFGGQGAAELAQMMPTATLLNVVRGEMVDPGAPIDALHGNRLAGAATDACVQDRPTAAVRFYRSSRDVHPAFRRRYPWCADPQRGNGDRRCGHAGHQRPVRPERQPVRFPQSQAFLNFGDQI